MPDPGVNGDLLERFLEDGIPTFRLYEPRDVFAVIGAAGKPPRDLRPEALAADGVAVRQRRGGGGAVILSPGQVVIALVAEVPSPFANREYAQAINGWVIEALEGIGVRGILQRGITDLAIADRKILGTSIYRTRLVLFYQASLLVSNDVSLFARYLAAPYRQPDYRRGRDHEAFCTTLVREGHDLDPDRVIEALRPAVLRRMPELAK